MWPWIWGGCFFFCRHQMKEEVSHWKKPCQKNNFLKYKVWSFYVCFFPRLKTTINFFDIKRILLWQPSNKACLQFYARTTDKRWLNPWFLAAQIQIPVPNKYSGFGYKGLVFCRNNGWLMEIMVKGLTVPKWVLINWPKISQMAQNLSAQIVCPSPKVWDFDKKKGFIGRP